jgi:hypothetical protein
MFDFISNGERWSCQLSATGRNYLQHHPAEITQSNFDYI